MGARIETLFGKDESGTTYTILPRTSTKAVIDESGNTASELITHLSQEVSEIKDDIDELSGKAETLTTKIDENAANISGATTAASNAKSIADAAQELASQAKTDAIRAQETADATKSELESETNTKIAELDSKKVDKDDNKSLINSGYSDSINIIEDSYFADVVTDSKGRIVEGTKSDGTKYIYKIKSETISNLEKSVESRVLKEEGKSLIIQDFANSLNAEDNKEFIEVSLDTKGRIIKALKRDGTSVFANIDSPTINDIYNKLKVVDITSTNQWTDKTALFYGDSVTAQSNHGTEQPYENENAIWATKVCKVLNFKKYYCRGIGGATWSPMNKIAYIDQEGRPQSNTITNYTKESAPIIEGYTIVDGGMACWERITTQIPESIRLSIDMIFMFCHNQEASSFNPSFSKLNVWDTLWMESPLNIYGGDYDITDCGNAIVSAVMKLQTWCPNARIVIGTGVSGRGKNDGSISTDLNTSINLQQEQEITKKIANTLSIPCVDVWGTDGINVFNRNRFIADGVHPTQDGGQMMAKAIIGGLKNVYPINY